MSNVNPADLSAAARPVILEEFSHESSDAASTAERKPDREGLPPGYRMRADAHYVDQLISRRSEKVLADPPAAPLRERFDARERRTERVLAQLSEDMATIGSASALLGSDVSPMGRKVSTDLIKAQSWRAAWLLRANAILDGTHRAHARPRPLRTILDQVRDRFAAECRVTGATLDLHASDWNATITSDEDGLVTAIAGAVIATLGLIGSAEAVTIRITASVASGELRSIEVTQDDVTVPAAAAARLFDQSFQQPASAATSLGAWSARTIAQQHGGDVVMLAADRRGSTLRMTFGHGL